MHDRSRSQEQNIAQMKEHVLFHKIRVTKSFVKFRADQNLDLNLDRSQNF